MQGQDHTKVTRESHEPAEPLEQPVAEIPADHKAESTPAPRLQAEKQRVDWLAIGVAIIIAAFFALGARINPQPSTSLAPAAVLSATGCGLLVTAIRKLRSIERPGLFESALAGLFLALFQFIVAISYPNVVYSLNIQSDQRLGFLSTWGLIAAFSVLFSIVGAALGHMAFAPLRPLPATSKKKSLQDPPGSAVEENDIRTQAQASTQPRAVSQQHLFVGYFISVSLLGLAPIVVGYVFSAAFDYMLSVNHFFPGPYPTLHLLSALLPWQVPISVNISSNNPNVMFFFLWQLWRFPVFLGNPTMFDLQALEPYIFNGAALALLLLTLRDQKTKNSARSPLIHWLIYLALAALLGLLLVLPADLWIVRGLEGLLQNPLISIQIRTLHILNQLTFTLNLITGPILCLGLALLLRLFYIKRVQVSDSSSPGSQLDDTGAVG